MANNGTILLQRLRDLLMGQPLRPFSNRQGTTVERFRLPGLPLRHVQLSQIYDTQCHVGMLETQEFLFDGQRPCQQGLRLSILSIHAVEDPQVVEHGGDIGMIFSMHGLVNLQRLQIYRFGLHVLPLASIDLRQL